MPQLWGDGLWAKVIWVVHFEWGVEKNFGGKVMFDFETFTPCLKREVPKHNVWVSERGEDLE